MNLKQLIESDATATSLAAADDWAACAIRCNEITPTIRQPASVANMRRLAALNGVWAAIVLTSRESSAAPDVIKGICVTLIEWTNHADTLDFDLPEVQAMAQALISAGVVTQQQFADLSALGNTKPTHTPLECRVAIKGE